MTEFNFNGQDMSEREFLEALDETQELIVAEEKNIRDTFGVSDSTAGAIMYLRSRSRWTQEKEQELIDRDKAGDPISLGTVLSGEF